MKTIRGLGWALVLTLTAGAAAQDYPVKPVRMIVLFAPGGGADVLARVVAQKLTESMGQQVVIDYRAGAGGKLGAELAARATPDGHTVLMVSASYAGIASLYKLDFDPVKDLTPVTQLNSWPSVLAATPSLPANSISELIALARAKPGQVIYASSGIGGLPHFSGALFTMMTNTQMTHVPYKGGGPAVIDLIGGRVQLLFGTVTQALPHIKSGRLKAIAMCGLQRSPLLPGLPTIAESGVPGYDMTNWFGMAAPGATPARIIARLNKEVLQHLQSADFRSRLAADGADPVGNSPAEFGRLIRSELEKYARIVKATDIRVD
jgi:tripartite-type tricarboxylate transporter receptor subunit TctC